MGKWMSNLKGLFKSGPMKEMAESVSEPAEKRAVAEEVKFTDEFKQRFSERRLLSPEQRSSFQFSLLVMAAYIVQADGKVEEEEYAYMSKFLGRNFGPEAEQESMDVLRKLVKKYDDLATTKPNAYLQFLGECGQQMSELLSEDLRYQLLSMLVMIVKSDGVVDVREMTALKDVAIYMGLKGEHVDSLMVLDASLAKEGWPVLNY